MLCLGEAAGQLVKGTWNPVDLWKKLQKLFEQQGYSSRFFIWKKFYELRLGDFAKSDERISMSLYINAHWSLCQQLWNAGAIMDNEIEHLVLLFGFGDSYDSFVITTTQSFQQTGTDNQIYTDVENLIGQLLNEDWQWKGVRLGMELVKIGSPILNL